MARIILDVVLFLITIGIQVHGKIKASITPISRVLQSQNLLPPFLHTINLTSRNIEYAAAFGFPNILEANNPSAPVVACTRLDATIDVHGYRCSTSDAFLPKKLARSRRKNLSICTGAIVTSLDMVSNNGTPKVVGVYFEADTTTKIKPSTKYHASVAGEVILCCGAIATPQLLMLRLVLGS